MILATPWRLTADSLLFPRERQNESLRRFARHSSGDEIGNSSGILNRKGVVQPCESTAHELPRSGGTAASVATLMSLEFPSKNNLFPHDAAGKFGLTLGGNG